MSDAGAAFQTAIFTALSANSTLTSLAAIYDGAPQDAAFPHVDLGEVEERDWSTKTTVGSEHFITLHVWSRAAGKKQTHQIIEQLRITLHDATLSMPGHKMVLIRFINHSISRDADGITYHGIVQFRALTQDT